MRSKSFIAVIDYREDCLYLFYVNSDLMQCFSLPGTTVFFQVFDQGPELPLCERFEMLHLLEDD
jgi:hypothetical protein